jgi:hypothetical protein
LWPIENLSNVILLNARLVTRQLQNETESNCKISVSCPTGEEWRVSEHDQASVTDDERIVEQMIEKLIVDCKRSWSWQWNVIEVAIFSTTLSAMCYLIYFPEWFFFFFLCHDLLTYFFLFFFSVIFFHLVQCMIFWHMHRIYKLTYTLHEKGNRV